MVKAANMARPQSCESDEGAHVETPPSPFCWPFTGSYLLPQEIRQLFGSGLLQRVGPRTSNHAANFAGIEGRTSWNNPDAGIPQPLPQRGKREAAANSLTSPRHAFQTLALGELNVAAVGVDFLEALRDRQIRVCAAIRFGLQH
jgi:hypothetical protein